MHIQNRYEYKCGKHIDHVNDQHKAKQDTLLMEVAGDFLYDIMDSNHEISTSFNIKFTSQLKVQKQINRLGKK